MRRRCLAILVVVVPLLSAIAAQSGFAASAKVVSWPIAGFAEPSGLVYHPGRNTLFVVGDEGEIGEVDLEGRLLRSRAIGGDLEGVTCDPASGLLYAVQEGRDVIIEIRPDDFRVLRHFPIDRTFDGNANFLERGGDGIEGITFVPVPGHPEGGRFFVVNQYDPPVLVELLVPIRSGEGRLIRATIVGQRRIASPPLSGLVWDPHLGGFLIISALWRVVYLTDRDGRYLRSVGIPGFLQEGIARLPDGSFVIAQDSGGLLKWSPGVDPFLRGTGPENTHEQPATKKPAQP